MCFQYQKFFFFIFLQYILKISSEKLIIWHTWEAKRHKFFVVEGKHAKTVLLSELVEKSCDKYWEDESNTGKTPTNTGKTPTLGR
jgi:general stress protein 26